MTPPSAAAAPAVHPTDRRSAGPFAPSRPLRSAARPRRVSGPAPRPLDDRAARRRAPEYAGVAVGLIEALGRLSEHRLLDRLIRGRAWIALVASALIGIVTLQLGLLKLNAGIGQALRKETSLQRENAALSIENSELAAGDLVESSATRLGMEMVPAGALRFLSARPGTDAARGAAALSTPVGGSSAPTASGEASNSSSAGTSNASSASAGGSTQSGAPQPTSSSSGSEPEESKPSGESSAPQASSEPSPERSTEASATSPSQGTGSGPVEASGGTQPGSTGR